MMTEHSPWHLLHVLQRLAKERAAKGKPDAQQARLSAAPQSGDDAMGGISSDGYCGNVINELNPSNDTTSSSAEEQGSVASLYPYHEPHLGRELEIGTLEGNSVGLI